MKISIKSIKLNSKWDYQKAMLLLKMDGLDGKTLTTQRKDKLNKEVTLFLWKEINKQFPRIKEFCKGFSGGFNKSDERHYKTPIISIHGIFYMQLICVNDRDNWIWESIELEPLRFYFNEENYLRDLVVEAMNKSIMEGYVKKDKFTNLINALNGVNKKEKVIIMKTKGKDLGKVDLKEIDTKIN